MDFCDLGIDAFLADNNKANKNKNNNPEKEEVI